MMDVEKSGGEPDHDTIFAALDALISRDRGRVLLRTPDTGVSWTRSAFVEAAETVASALKTVVRGPYAAGLLMGNRPEFFIADMAVLLSGGVPVSLYPTAAAEQQQYVIGHAEIAILFVERAKLETLFAATQTVHGLRMIVVVDDKSDLPPASPSGCAVVALQDLISSGARGITVAETASRAHPDDLMTIIYTSGTTGSPKGVRLSHRNLLTAGHGIGTRIGLQEGDRVIAWLPHAHVAERTCHYCCPILFGLDVTTCHDARLLPQVLRTVEPDWFGAFPRVWEKLKLHAEVALAAYPNQKRLRQALVDGLLSARLKQQGDCIDPSLADRVDDADRDLFAPLRQKMGLSRARALSTGSAPTPLHVLEFFASVGMHIGDIFGATETCTYGAIGSPGQIRMGSAGTVVPGMEMKIAEDGEILLRGASVMQGYHKAPEQTAEVMTADGWYRTGDLGHLDGDGFLWITGRKKELIISSGGQNMSPSYIESMIKSGSSLIGQVCVIGDRRPFNTALIALDVERVRRFVDKPGLNVAELARHPAVEAEIARGVATGNARLARVEQIKRFVIVPCEWELGGDELTPTMKLRRRRTTDKYADTIQLLYSDKPVEPCLAASVAEQAGG